MYEISAALKHLKEGKSAGDDKIKSDFMLCDENNLKYVLTELFNMIYHTEHFPDQWATIFKKGNKENPTNYRGITFNSTMGKLFTYMLNQRFTAWAEESNFLSNAQFAYRTGYDTIFVLQSVLCGLMRATDIHVWWSYESDRHTCLWSYESDRHTCHTKISMTQDILND